MFDTSSSTREEDDPHVPQEVGSTSVPLSFSGRLTSLLTGQARNRSLTSRWEHWLDSGEVAGPWIEPGIPSLGREERGHPIVSRFDSGVGSGGDDRAGPEPSAVALSLRLVSDRAHGLPALSTRRE